MIQDLPTIATGIVAFLTAILQLRYYRLVRSTSFLWFSGVFLSLGFNLLNFTIFEQTVMKEILSIITVALLFFCLIQLLITAGSEKMLVPLHLLRTGVITYILIFIPLTWISRNTDNNTRVTLIRIATEEFLQIFVSLSIIYIYWTLKLTRESPRTNRIKNSWIGFGVILFILSTIRFPIYLILTTAYLSSESSYENLQNLENIGFLTLDLGIIAIGVLLFLLAVVYPESLLLNEEQILRVAQLYDNADKLEAGEGRKLYTETFLLEYLKDISSMDVGSNNLEEP